MLSANLRSLIIIGCPEVDLKLVAQAEHRRLCNSPTRLPPHRGQRSIGRTVDGDANVTKVLLLDRRRPLDKLESFGPT